MVSVSRDVPLLGLFRDFFLFYSVQYVPTLVLLVRSTVSFNKGSVLCARLNRQVQYRVCSTSLLCVLYVHVL